MLDVFSHTPFRVQAGKKAINRVEVIETDPQALFQVGVLRPLDRQGQATLTSSGPQHEAVGRRARSCSRHGAPPPYLPPYLPPHPPPHPPPLLLRGATPHAGQLAVVEGGLETFLAHRTLRAELAGGVLVQSAAVDDERLMAESSTLRQPVPCRPIRTRPARRSPTSGASGVISHSTSSLSMRVPTVGPRRDNLGDASRPGDRSPGFTAEVSRCWALLYDRNLQSTHCLEQPTFTGRWHSPRGDGQWWRVLELPRPLERADGRARVRPATLGPDLSAAHGDDVRTVKTFSSCQSLDLHGDPQDLVSSRLNWPDR